MIGKISFLNKQNLELYVSFVMVLYRYYLRFANPGDYEG